MIGASLYIIGCTLKNRTLRWLKRLREPRYFVAILAGFSYFYFVVFGWARRRESSLRSRGGENVPSLVEFLPALPAAGPVIGGAALLVLSAASWLLPGGGALLDFSRSEVQFLFPAPVSRRQLIVHRMLRSQIGMLFGPVVVAVLVPFGTAPTRMRAVMTLWMVLFSARAYFSAIALQRVRMASPDPRQRQLARLPLVLILGGLAVVGLNIARALWGPPLIDLDDALSRIAVAGSTGLPRIALWPFVALISPAFAPDWVSFGRALPAAMAVVLAAAAWVLLNDEVFADMTREVADARRAQPVSPGKGRAPVYRPRTLGWTLAPIGRAELAFAWKGAIQTFRVVGFRMVLRVVMLMVWIGFVVAASSRGLAASMGVFAIIATAMSVLLGPLMLRIDLRQDLQHLQLLKTWPVRAAVLVRGEILWPATLLTVTAWFMTGVGTYLSGSAIPSASLTLRLSVGIAACLIAPALIVAQLLVHNSIALVFPAWVSFGSWRARGVDAVGQRLILIGGTLLMVLLAALPGAIAGGLIWLAFSRFIGVVALVPAAAVCAGVIGIEGLLVTEALGPAYERLDVTSVEVAELG